MHRLHLGEGDLIEVRERHDLRPVGHPGVWRPPQREHSGERVGASAIHSGKRGSAFLVRGSARQRFCTRPQLNPRPQPLTRRRVGQTRTHRSWERIVGS